MLRALPQVADVAALLQRAWSAQTGGALEALATPASNPPSEASQQGLQPSMG
jgi:Rps23 Pro-64 3,4-dihydroxylase Tpa1-like proline 4-hydroxylase